MQNVLNQEKVESHFLSQGYNTLTLTKKEKECLGPINNQLRNTLIMEYKFNDLLNCLPHAPKYLGYEATVDWYIGQLKKNEGYNILEEMHNRSTDQYMQFEHQKSFAKAYFVPLLQKVFDFCDHKGYNMMAQAMRFNIKDETGQWPESQIGNKYDDSTYVYPEFSSEDSYKGEPHSAWRVYEYDGLTREYGKSITDERNIGMLVFNYLTGKLLNESSEQFDFMRIGATTAAEKIIPEEFKYMKKARDRLFPGLTQKERHYIDDHIQHDAEFHFQDILTGFKEMQLTPTQEQWIKDGIHLFYIGRAFSYSAFAKQIHTNEKFSKTLQLSFIKKMKYATAACILFCIALIGIKNHQNYASSLDMTQISAKNIQYFEEIVAQEMGVYDEYMSGKSENFIMTDYVGYEAMRRAIKLEQGIDIGAY